MIGLRRSAVGRRLLDGWQAAQHTGHGLLDGSDHRVRPAQQILDIVLRPAAPDQPLAARVHDIDHQSAGFVRDGRRDAIAARTVAVRPIELVGIQAMRHVGVVMNQEIGVAADDRDAALRELLLDRALQAILEQRIPIEGDRPSAARRRDPTRTIDTVRNRAFDRRASSPSLSLRHSPQEAAPRLRRRPCSSVCACEPRCFGRWLLVQGERDASRLARKQRIQRARGSSRARRCGRFRIAGDFSDSEARVRTNGRAR